MRVALHGRRRVLLLASAVLALAAAAAATASTFTAGLPVRAPDMPLAGTSARVRGQGCRVHRGRQRQLSRRGGRAVHRRRSHGTRSTSIELGPAGPLERRRRQRAHRNMVSTDGGASWEPGRRTAAVHDLRRVPLSAPQVASIAPPIPGSASPPAARWPIR